ncbi:hypothetical protein TIFTF001_030839 [Ficus carica]|uniref:Uncharacterized protein n=1 Tax=Ficus carica TaxID=3494 RepID=A0AA88DU27_FICCA|nr:hypothetical protein TIFTF001_030839 [Ficus carica]
MAIRFGDDEDDDEAILVMVKMRGMSFCLAEMIFIAGLERNHIFSTTENRWPNNSYRMGRRPRRPSKEFIATISTRYSSATTSDGTETRQPKVLNSRTVEPDGTSKRVTPAEAVLNWQTENLIAQNKVLQKINHKLSQVDSKIDQSNIGLIRSQTILERLESQIQMLHQELRSLAMTSSFSSRLFAEKEAEMESLQTQLTALQKQAHRGFTEPSEVPWRYTTIPKQEQPLSVVPQKENHIKRLMRLLDEDDALRKLKAKGKQKELPSSSQMMVQSQPQNPLTAIIKNHCMENLPQIQILDPNTSSEEESVLENSDWSSDVSMSSEPEAGQTSSQPIMMNQPPPEPMMSEVQDETPEVTQQPRQSAQTSKTTSNGKVQLITLDDIPLSQRRDRFQEFKAFLFLQICINKELFTKCPNNPTPGCSCSSCSSKPSSRIRKFRKKKGFRRNNFFSKKKGSWKFLRKRRNFSKTRSTKCFICGSKNRFMKNCPKAKTQKMIIHINKETWISHSDNEIESIFSVDDEINDHTLCVLQLSEFDEQSELDPESDGQALQMNAINIAQTTPMMIMKVIPSKYANPIRVAALFDTGESFSIMNPDILPLAY